MNKVDTGPQYHPSGTEQKLRVTRVILSRFAISQHNYRKYCNILKILKPYSFRVSPDSFQKRIMSEVNTDNLRNCGVSAKASQICYNFHRHLIGFTLEWAFINKFLWVLNFVRHDGTVLNLNKWTENAPGRTQFANIRQLLGRVGPKQASSQLIFPRSWTSICSVVLRDAQALDKF